MPQVVKTAQIRATNTTGQTLPEPAARVLAVNVLDPAAANPNTLINYPVVSAAPAAGQVQFTGRPEAPSSTLTFNAALTANSLVLVDYVPVGQIARYL